jgi:hypothetical protein
MGWSVCGREETSLTREKRFKAIVNEEGGVCCCSCKGNSKWGRQVLWLWVFFGFGYSPGATLMMSQSSGKELNLKATGRCKTSIDVGVHQKLFTCLFLIFLVSGLRSAGQHACISQNPRPRCILHLEFAPAYRGSYRPEA